MNVLQAVLRKELREQYLTSGRPRNSLIVLAVLQCILAVTLASVGGQVRAQLGDHALVLLAVPIILAAASFTSFMMPANVVIDMVAGERERHTLETLLASPAPDRAILGAKALSILVAAAAQAAFFALACLLASLVWLGPAVALGILPWLVLAPVLGMFAASFTTGLGLLISQRVRTIKAGQQILGYCLLPIYLVFFLARLVAGAFMHLTPFATVAVAVGSFALLLALDATFWILAFVLFSRPRLMR